MESKKLAVIGGGAAGLAAVAEVNRNNPDVAVTIFDRMPKAGKKLLATGNGRCNFSNEDLSLNHFHGNNAFLNKILTSLYSDDEAFFREMGMLSYHEDGRIYPRSQQASAVRDALINEATARNVSFCFEKSISDIRKEKGCFIVDSNRFDAVIICGGGKAAPAQGSDGSCYKLAEKMGHTITPLYPALCGLTTSDKSLNMLKGVRCECKATLYCNGSIKGEEAGEVQFTDKGISGIPVMNLSHLCADHKDLRLSLDLCSDISEDELFQHISDTARKYPVKETEDILSGIINNKLGFAVMNKACLKAHMPAGSLKAKEIQSLTRHLKDFSIEISGTRGYDNAQVTRGGVKTDDINPDTMMSKLSEGLFFAGEILDIHGDCGGYNLHLAFTTGRIAGISASEYLK